MSAGTQTAESNKGRIGRVRDALVSGDISAADSMIADLLAAEPRNAEVLRLRGILRAQTGDWSQAIRDLTTAIAIGPSQRQWQLDLAAIYLASAEAEAAVEIYASVLNSDTDDAQALRGYVLSLTELKNFDDASHAYKWLTRNNDQDLAVLRSLVNGLIAADRCQDALRIVTDAGRDGIRSPDLEGLFAQTFSALGHDALARESWSRVVEQSPDDFHAREELIRLCWKQGDLDATMSHSRFVIDSGNATTALRSLYLYLMLYSPNETPQSIRQACVKYGDSLSSSRIAPFVRPATDPDKTLRIGYLSGEFMMGATFYFLAPLLACHGFANVELFCYDTSPSFDERTEFYARLSNWHDCRAMDDDSIVDLITRDGIDILVDCSGVFPANSLKIFARRAAPVQVAYPICPMTTGIEEMDYILTDAWTCPQGQEGQYREKAWRIDSGYFVYAPPEDSPTVPPLPAIANGFLTFGLFQRVAKMNSGVWDSVSRVLVASPRSRLLIQNIDETLDHVDSRARRLLTDEFSRRGVGAERIDFVGRRNQRECMRIMSTVDIALDTFPYQGQTTTCECLWMGVPVVALAGESHAARVGVSILSRLALQEIVASSQDDYVRIATSLATDVQKLSELRSGMRSRMRSSTLLNAPRLAQEMGIAYRSMWKLACPPIPSLSPGVI